MRRCVQGEHPSSLVWLLFFVYICFCSRQVPYCSGSVKHAHMLYPVGIHTVSLLRQRLQIAPVPCIPFTLGLVTCHPPDGSPNGLVLLLLTPCSQQSTCCWCGLIFLIYIFGIGLLNVSIYTSSQLIISRQLCLPWDILPCIFRFRFRPAPGHFWWIPACPLPHLFDPKHLFH